MTLQIGEVADLFKISTKALRHYEKIGLLQPVRDGNGYRLYRAEDVLCVQRIRHLQGLGLSLRQIAAILSEEARGDLWQSVLHGLLDETKAEIEALEARRARLERLLASDSAEPHLAPPIIHTNHKVDAYLEQHLSPAMSLQWRRDPAVYAFVGSLINEQRLIKQIKQPRHEFVGWISAEQPVGVPNNLFWVVEEYSQ